MHTKRAYKNVQIKVLGECHGVHVQSDTLLLADVFEKFQNMCLKIYKTDSIVFFCSRFSIGSRFKKD